MPVELTEALLSQAAGWEAMKRARAYLAQGQVLSSYWEPPLLRGVLQTADTSFRPSMVIKSAIDIENLCNCREAREWGKICAHAVAIGLHWLQAKQAATQITRTWATRRSGSEIWIVRRVGAAPPNRGYWPTVMSTADARCFIVAFRCPWSQFAAPNTI